MCDKGYIQGSVNADVTPCMRGIQASAWKAVAGALPGSEEQSRQHPSAAGQLALGLSVMLFLVLLFLQLLHVLIQVQPRPLIVPVRPAVALLRHHSTYVLFKIVVLSTPALGRFPSDVLCWRRSRTLAVTLTGAIAWGLGQGRRRRSCPCLCRC